MSIIHYTIALPMRWLAVSTHNMYACGYECPAWYMGKAIYALHDGMVAIEKNSKKFIDEDFMNNLFSIIHVKDKGNLGPLGPLVEYMKHYMGKLKLLISAS